MENRLAVRRFTETDVDTGAQTEFWRVGLFTKIGDEESLLWWRVNKDPEQFHPVGSQYDRWWTESSQRLGEGKMPVGQTYWLKIRPYWVDPLHGSGLDCPGMVLK